MDLSLEQQLAALPSEEQAEALAGLDPMELLYSWEFMGRPSQIVPTRKEDGGEDFSVALLLGGRGAGKSRSMTEWVRDLDKNWAKLGRDPGRSLKGALLGRTSADVRDILLEGPSGLMNIYPPSEVDALNWIPSRRLVELPYGGTLLTFSAEEPDQLRGPAFHIGVADELAAHKWKPGVDGLTAWDNLRIGTRMGRIPQILAATTPKRVAVLRKLIADAKDPAKRILLKNMATKSNPYLSGVYLDVLMDLYEGTTLGQQELDGVMLDEVDGAQVAESTIEAFRVNQVPTLPGTRWAFYVGVDPSVAERPNDECGIVVVAVPLTHPVLKRHAYVIADYSFRASPSVWGDKVIQVAREHQATVIVETNQGGALVKRVIRQAASHANTVSPPVREVWATASKAVRFGPVAAAYEKGRIHHVGYFVDLEDQETSWVPGESGYSPDRMDAAGWALAAALFPDALKGGAPGSATTRTVTQRPAGFIKFTHQSRTSGSLTIARGIPNRRRGRHMP